LLDQIADLLSHTFLDIIVLTIWAFANIYALVMLCFKFKKSCRLHTLSEPVLKTGGSSFRNLKNSRFKRADLNLPCLCEIYEKGL